MTGQVRWVFQAVHHDLWDMDMPAQPELVDWRGPDGVAQRTAGAGEVPGARRQVPAKECAPDATQAPPASWQRSTAAW